MNPHLRVLMLDAHTGFYRMKRYQIGDFFGPVDLGLHLFAHYNSLNIGVGLLAGSVFPGSNRLIISGFSPCWSGFYVSSMGGAGLVFDDLGVNLLAVIGRADRPSALILNREHGEEIQVRLEPLNVQAVWSSGRGGVYGVLDHVYDLYGDEYEKEPRILAVGPAAQATDFGAVASAPIRKGRLTNVDTWAGRGGLGSRMLQTHGLAAVVYGGSYIDQDFRDRQVADDWFKQRYNKKMAAKDIEATTKYRFDPEFETGGTFGVNYAKVGGRVMAFNYRSLYMTEDQRLRIHQDFIVDHYLKQFNEETIANKHFSNCGEPCAAVCKKMNQQYKKDYEPYQTMGPLCGIFDQRAAERLNHQADRLGFDAINVGGVLAWMMDALDQGLFTPEDLAVTREPIFDPDGFDIEADSMHNAELGLELLDSIIEKRGLVDLSEGARKFARRQARVKGKALLDLFVYNANARQGWMVPNQYWTPGVLSPMPVLGRYYMYYGDKFYSPRQLGRVSAQRMVKELTLDNLGICRFHRAWAEDMIPEVIDRLYGLKDRFQQAMNMTASRINSRNSAAPWESGRNADFVYHFLKRKVDVEKSDDLELTTWVKYFEQDPTEGGLAFWFETLKGIHESLREF